MKKVLLGIAILMMTLPSIAGEWNWYGSARMGAWYWNRIRWYNEHNMVWHDSVYIDTNGIWQGADVDEGYIEDSIPRKRFVYDLQDNSRLGVKAKTERLGFGFEMGFTYTIKDIDIDFDQQRYDQRRRTVMRLRKLYGEWYINEYLTLLFGQTYTPANFFNSEQAFLDAGLYYGGELYTGAHPMIQFSGDFEFGEMFNLGAKVSWVKVDTSLFVLGKGPGKANERLKMEGSAKVGLNLGELLGLTMEGAGGYSGYEIQRFDDEGEPEGPYDVHSFIYAGNFTAKVWKFFLGFTCTFAQNPNTYGMYLGNPWAWRLTKSMDIFYPRWGLKQIDSLTTDTLIYNSKIKMLSAVMKINPFEWLTVEGGIGRVKLDHEDEENFSEILEGKSNEARKLVIYGNLQFKLIEQHLIFIPEYTYNDFGGYFSQGGEEPEGIWHAAGLKVQVDL
jgi:hypothetical protein